jgi:hypothetical protein
MQRFGTVERVLADAAWPTAGWLKEIVLLAGGVGLLAVSAQLQVRLPFSLVPVTGQTLVVLLLGAALGSRRGPAVVASYLVLGLLGAPVFAAATAGPVRLVGPTGGYLVGSPDRHCRRRNGDRQPMHLRDWSIVAGAFCGRRLRCPCRDRTFHPWGSAQDWAGCNAAPGRVAGGRTPEWCDAWPKTMNPESLTNLADESRAAVARASTETADAPQRRRPQSGHTPGEIRPWEKP